MKHICLNTMLVNVQSHLYEGVGKIHVCIAYKTYTVEELINLLYSQLITYTMQILEVKNKKVYIGVVNFKTKIRST